MKKVLLIIVVAALIFGAWYCGGHWSNKCCKKGVDGTAVEGKNDNTYIQTFIFCGLQDDPAFTNYVSINGDTLREIKEGLCIYVDYGNHGQVQQQGSFTNEFRFWKVKKGEQPDPNKPTSTQKDRVKSDDILSSKSHSTIQIVGSSDPIKYVINPPTSPTGPTPPPGP